MTVEDRLLRWSIPEPNSGCWIWLSEISENGYGRISIAGRHFQAHRVSYEHFVGPTPEGLQVDHLCRTRCCINPAHLEPVTPSENIRRSPLATRALRSGTKAAAAKKLAATHCKRGHELTPDNVYIFGPRSRRCKKCFTEAQNERRRAKRAHVEPRSVEEIREQARKAALVGAEKRRSATHCKQGHPFSSDNLYIVPGGGRRCRKCQSTRQRAYRAAKTLRRAGVLPTMREPSRPRGYFD